MDRIRPREIQQEPDTPLIGAFGGLSSASLNITGDIIYQDKLVNAFVDKAGQLRKRTGSTSNAAVAWYDGTDGYGVHRFRFDSLWYLLVKTSDALNLYVSRDGLSYSSVGTKLGVFSPSSVNEKPTFATKVEGRYCYVFIATSYSQLIVLTLVRSTVSVTTSGNTVSATLAKPINGSVITASNSVLRSGSNFHIANSVAHSGASLTFTSPTINTTTVPSGTLAEVHSAFWLRCCPSTYYPGLYLVNSALRRNSVPLDVNVQVPVQLSDNPIINEGTQDVTRQTLRVFAAGALQTFLPGRNPTANTEWSFSDGSYYTGAGLLTNPSPAFISFGGIVGTANTTISISRLRKALEGNPIANLGVFVDKVSRTPTYYDGNTNTIASGVPVYWAFAGINIDLNLAAVVEMVDFTNYAGYAATSSLVDLDEANASLTINDGFCVPLYGYSFIVGGRTFANTVAVVGNRILLTGADSRIVFSNADWLYRGLSWNNFQISSINFSSNSAFSINLAQGSSEIRAITTVNGTTIAATDIGIFRISGSSANLPPNAETAIVSRVSNEILRNNNCFSVYDNKVFYVSSNGMFQLQYENEANELTNSSLSSNVSNRFEQANSLSFSAANRSFLVGFANSSELLAFNIDSESWYTIKFATSATPIVERDNDGFYFVITSGTDRALLSCVWSNSVTTDVSNLSGFFPYPLPGRLITITHVPTSCDGLVCPAELIKTLTTANVLVASGENHVRLEGAASITLVEFGSIVTPMPITAYVVTKAFFGDRLDRTYRVRGVNLITTGAGSLVTRIGFIGDSYSDRVDEVQVWNVGTNVYAGEPLLNAQLPTSHVRSYEGDTTVVKLRTLGMREAANLAMKIDGLSVVGIQFDTSRKSNKRLR